MKRRSARAASPAAVTPRRSKTVRDMELRQPFAVPCQRTSRHLSFTANRCRVAHPPPNANTARSRWHVRSDVARCRHPFYLVSRETPATHRLDRAACYESIRCGADRPGTTGAKAALLLDPLADNNTRTHVQKDVGVKPSGARRIHARVPTARFAPPSVSRETAQHLRRTQARAPGRAAHQSARPRPRSVPARVHRSDSHNVSRKTWKPHRPCHPRHDDSAGRTSRRVTQQRYPSLESTSFTWNTTNPRPGGQ